jgi:hypothetical protein
MIPWIIYYLCRSYENGIQPYNGYEERFFSNDDVITVAKTCGKNYYYWMYTQAIIHSLSPEIKKEMEEMGFVIHDDKVIFYNDDDYKKLVIWVKLK